LGGGAAWAMRARLPALNAGGERAGGEPMAIGIGLNSGAAQVGNTGSPRKFKYGPLGSSVNLASRVQGATKQLKTRLLLTAATYEALKNETLRTRARRLGTVQHVGIDSPVSRFG